MIVRVVMSRATRVPAVSLALSTLFRHPTTYLGPLLALTMTAVKQHLIVTESTAELVNAFRSMRNW